MTKSYLDTVGLTSLWAKIKSLFATKTELASKANDSDVVHKSGDETIEGNKTFRNELHITADNFDPTEASATEGWFSNALRFYGNKGGLLCTLQGYKLPNNRNRMTLFVRTKDSDETFNFYDDGTFYAKSITGGPFNIDCSVESHGNGYIRYSNGLQVCWALAQISGASYINVNFAAVFSSEPIVTLGCFGGGSDFPHLAWVNTTGCCIDCGRSIPSDATFRATYIAIGYWK